MEMGLDQSNVTDLFQKPLNSSTMSARRGSQMVDCVFRCWSLALWTPACVHELGVYVDV